MSHKNPKLSHHHRKLNLPLIISLEHKSAWQAMQAITAQLESRK